MKLFNKKIKKNQDQVISVFKDQTTFEKTLNDLRDNEFQNEKIAIFMPKNEDFKIDRHNSNANEAATTGLVTGVVTGGIVGWLAGLNTFLIPRVGLFVAGGPLASAITGVAIGGTIGSIGGALISLGLSRLESKGLENFIKDKGYIISVHIKNPREQLIAKNIFVKNGAIKIYERTEKAFYKTKDKKHLSHKLSEWPST